MISLILSILSSTIILIVFKVIEKQKVAIFPAIVVNYIAASVLGFSINGSGTLPSFSSVSPWIFFSVVIGIMLIVNFYLIGNSTQKAGIALTVVSAKMSFVLPVLFSLLFDINDTITLAKVFLLMLAMASVIMAMYPDKGNTARKSSLIFPILIFFGLGLLDTLIKYCQYHFITTPEISSLFSAVNFSIAGIIGLLILLFSKKNQKLITQARVWLIGIILGVANFGSMYFLINALNELKYDNSLVFGINNMGIVAVSVVIAYFIYKERFSKINWTGMILSLLVLMAMIRIFM